MKGKVTDAFWRRKSEAWEAVEILYKSQIPAEQRRLLKPVRSNCSFDRGTLCPTYTSPFDLLERENETGNWRRGWAAYAKASAPSP